MGELIVMGLVVSALSNAVSALRPNRMIEQWRTTLYFESEICQSLAVSGARSVFPGILVVAGIEIVAITAMAQPILVAWVLVVTVAHLGTAIWIATVFVQKCQEARNNHFLWMASLVEGVVLYAGILGANLVLAITCCFITMDLSNPTLPFLVFLAVDLSAKLLLADKNLKLISQRNRLLPEEV